MTPATRENFREALLLVLEERASDRFGLGVTAIRTFLAQHGFRQAPPEEINAELRYLADKQFVAIVGKAISPENTCWRITAEGRDHVAQGGANE